MAVILRNSGNTGTLHVVNEATGREFMSFDPTCMTIKVSAGVKVVCEDDPKLPDGKVPLDEMLLSHK